jgi:hypothetical protein
VEDHWIDRRQSGPFRYHADFRLADCEALVEELFQLQAELVRTLGVAPAKEPIDVYLFRGKQEYQNFLRRHFPHVPYRQALFIKSQGPGQVFAYRHADFEIDLRHESTHALLHASLDMVPLWLDEGLAEYFEMPAPQRPYDHPHLSALRWNLRLGIFLELENLEQKEKLDEMRLLEYRYAWAWVHFMLHGPESAHREMVAFLGDIQASTPPGRLSERLVGAVPGIRQQWIGHFRNWRRPEQAALFNGQRFGYHPAPAHV